MERVVILDYVSMRHSYHTCSAYGSH